MVDSANSLDGVLSGLIGARGAIGVFKSGTHSSGSTAFDYAGGFIVAPTAVAELNCVARPFDARCDSDSGTEAETLLTARIDACFNAVRPDGLPLESTDCIAPNITSVICEGTEAMANPFASFCDAASIANLADLRSNFITACGDESTRGYARLYRY